MINQEILEKLKEIVLSCLKKNNLELFEINYYGRGKPQLTILIDRPQGGITIDECAIMNRIISEALDSANILDSSYVLEVSSPGVDRPLKERGDFSRVINKRIRCILLEPISGKKEIEGKVCETNDESVTLDTDSGYIKILYNNITKAKQIVD